MGSGDGLRPRPGDAAVRRRAGALGSSDGGVPVARLHRTRGEQAVLQPARCAVIPRERRREGEQVRAGAAARRRGRRQKEEAGEAEPHGVTTAERGRESYIRSWLGCDRPMRRQEDDVEPRWTNQRISGDVAPTAARGGRDE